MPIPEVLLHTVSKAQRKAEGRNEAQGRKAGGIKRKPGYIKEQDKSCFLADQGKLSTRNIS
jgi:hypothetical protein